MITTRRQRKRLRRIVVYNELSANETLLSTDSGPNETLVSTTFCLERDTTINSGVVCKGDTGGRRSTDASRKATAG